MSVLAIIPARGGSKGVPQKNKKLLNGLPLVEYSIDAALNCSLISDVFVSTDDQEIADIARARGVDVPFLRPLHLASDSSPTIDTVLHVLQYFEEKGKHFEVLCLLQPTVPFRDKKDLCGAITKFLESAVDTLISMRKVPHIFHPEWVYKEEDGKVDLYLGGNVPVSRRQDLADVWHRDGSVYITKTEVILERKTLYGDSITNYEMINSPNINIDTLEDWESAEAYITLLDD